MTKTKFFPAAAAAIVAAGVIGVAIAQNTAPYATPAAPADKPATPAVTQSGGGAATQAPGATGTSSASPSSSSSGAGSMNTDTAAKSDRG